MSSFLYYSIFILCSTFLYSIDGVLIRQFVRSGGKTENLSHLHFFFHDILGGKNPTSVRIIGPPNGTAAGFGSTMMIDNALTEEQDRASKLVGRAQGFYSVASQQADEFALLMVMNFVFVEGKYKGSSISILGRNPVLNDVREMPVVGGTGQFRSARGYALAHTVWFDANTGDAIVEYNVYVSES
ncbi:hypothetical protein PS2_039506 [Malus domestica]|uniref:dirigent protein 22-like n=1 Tax=Malus domestica TaxID=3750 RepID=UPI0010AA194A|nr:dirigent protein 22-like [Malus domestica]